MSSISELVQWRRVPERALNLYRLYEDDIKEAWEKQAYSPTLKKLMEWGNLIEGTYPGGIPNHPGPLTSMLTMGLAGAGLGYGAGVLGEKILPDKWKRGKLRRTLALLGGAAGAMPGLGYMAHNYMNEQPVLGNKLLQPVKISEEVRAAVQDGWEKVAYMSGTGVFFSPPIDVNEFNQIVWKDPRVSRPLPAATQAAATGLITGAANLPGKSNNRWVTPMDVARMSAGMGVGHLSGALVGKGLGLLMGMPDGTQEKLKQTGMWAGLLGQLIPKAFGG